MPDKTVRIDISEPVVEDLKIGSLVRVTLEGEVTELEAARTLELGIPGDESESEKFPPQMTVKVASTKVSMRSNAFTSLAEDEEDD
jgi:hypothetical protein